jgi:hypothetical protein
MKSPLPWLSAAAAGYISSVSNTLFMSPCHQTAHLRVAVHKVGRAVHGVDDPRGVLGARLVLSDGSAATLLTNESIKFSHFSYKLILNAATQLVLWKMLPQFKD